MAPKEPPKFDPEATRIDPDSRGNGPKISFDASEGVASASELADRYLHQLTRRGGAELEAEATTMLPSAEEQLRHVALTRPRDPAAVAFWGLILPGAGFFLLRRRLAGLSAFALVALSTVVFGVQIGYPAVPNFLHLQEFPKEEWAPRILFWAACTAVMWWLSVIVAVDTARRRFSSGYRQPRKAFTLLLTSPFPGLGHYVQGKFLRGHFLCFFVVSVPFLFLSLFIIWKQIPGVDAAAVANVDEWLPVLGVFSAIVLLVLGIGFLGSITGAIFEIGGGISKQSEKKFVVLGLGVVLVLTYFAAAGEPGRYLVRKGTAFAQTLKAKGFVHASAQLDSGISRFAEQINRLRDRLDLFN